MNPQNKGPFAAVAAGIALAVTPGGCKLMEPAFDDAGKSQGITTIVEQTPRVAGAVESVAAPVGVVPGPIGEVATLAGEFARAYRQEMDAELAQMRGEFLAGQRSVTQMQTLTAAVGAAVSAIGAVAIRRRDTTPRPIPAGGAQ